ILSSIITGNMRKHDLSERNKKKRKAPKKEALIKALMDKLGIDSDRPLSTLLELLGVDKNKQRNYSEAQLYRIIEQLLGSDITNVDPKTLARWLKNEEAR
ncbi:hypothetical protein EJN61_24025, partial [Salmonella enterica]|nr:hypothetical protein [Salmonella enterica]EFP4631662.1 hypothetical protein [Salmonella enterica]EFP4758696.1 hypothetical protein [Salmonella enterica]EGE7126201.1 hypothetical protein [Salmonella enterica]